MALIVDCKSSSLYWNRNNVTMLYFDDIKSMIYLHRQKNMNYLKNKVWYSIGKVKAREK